MTLHAVALGSVAWVTLSAAHSGARGPIVVTVSGDEEVPTFIAADESLPELETPDALEPTLLEAELPDPTLEPSPFDPTVAHASEDAPLEVPHIAMRWAGGAHAPVSAGEPVGEPPKEASVAAVVEVPPPPAVPEPEPVIVPAQLVSRSEPEYPRISRRIGEEGTVTLRIVIGVDGGVRGVEVVNSSGHSRLDDSALAAVKQWTFAAATRDGEPFESSLLHRITFQIEGQ